MKEGSHTPWGNAQNIEQIADGIWFVDTASHGGYKLDRIRNAQVNPAWREAGGWYEEDCQWSIAYITFPTIAKSQKDLENAHVTAKNWYPDEYYIATGKRVDISESRVLQRRRDEKLYADKWIVISATTGTSFSWGPVPDGWVGCHAALGGIRSKDLRRVLVRKEDYNMHATSLGYVLDESKCQPWEKSP